MKYNFTAKVEVDETSQSGFASIQEGLEVASSVTAKVSVNTNTELPETPENNKVEELRTKVSAYISDKLGSQVEAELTSVEL